MTMTDDTNEKPVEDKLAGMPGRPKSSVLQLNVSQLTPEERRYREFVIARHDRMLAMVADLTWDVQINIMKEVLLTVIRKNVPRGKKQAAARLLAGQLERALKMDDGGLAG